LGRKSGASKKPYLITTILYFKRYQSLALAISSFLISIVSQYGYFIIRMHRVRKEKCFKKLYTFPWLLVREGILISIGVGSFAKIGNAYSIPLLRKN